MGIGDIRGSEWAQSFDCSGGSRTKGNGLASRYCIRANSCAAVERPKQREILQSQPLLVAPHLLWSPQFISTSPTTINITSYNEPRARCQGAAADTVPLMQFTPANHASTHPRPSSATRPAAPRVVLMGSREGTHGVGTNPFDITYVYSNNASRCRLRWPKLGRH